MKIKTWVMKHKVIHYGRIFFSQPWSVSSLTGVFHIQIFAISVKSLTKSSLTSFLRSDSMLIIYSGGGLEGVGRTIRKTRNLLETVEGFN